MEYRVPKNVRQIGNVSDTPKIYVEDYVDTFLNQICDTSDEEPVGAFLVGKRVKKDEKECVYISGAIRIDEIETVGPDIAISDSVLEIADAERQKYFEDSFVGWCICIPGQPLRVNSNLNKIHNSLFGEEGSILIIKAAKSEEGNYFAYKYRDLMQIGGHFIYYEKNPAMQDYMIMSRKKIGVTPSEAVEDQAAKNFRNIVREKVEYQEQKKASRMMYAASVFLVLVILIMGVTTMNNYDKMKAMQSSVDYLKASMEGEPENKETVTASKEIVEDELPEQAEITSENTTDTTGTDAVDDTSDEEDEEIDDTQDAVSTMQEMSEDIYIVEKGDTLAKISKKVYGDVGHVDAICQMNGLSDGNLIFIGQKLLLP